MVVKGIKSWDPRKIKFGFAKSMWLSIHAQSECKNFSSQPRSAVCSYSSPMNAALQQLAAHQRIGWRSTELTVTFPAARCIVISWINSSCGVALKLFRRSSCSAGARPCDRLRGESGEVRLRVFPPRTAARCSVSMATRLTRPPHDEGPGYDRRRARSVCRHETGMM